MEGGKTEDNLKALFLTWELCGVLVEAEDGQTGGGDRMRKKWQCETIGRIRKTVSETVLMTKREEAIM